MNHGSNRLWLDLVVGGTAIIVSIASLWVALGQSRIQERMLAASVWPYLQYSSSDIPFNGPEIDFTLKNAGVGPARLQWVTLYYDRKPIVSMRAAIRKCCGATGSEPAVTEGLVNTVMTAGEMKAFFHLPKTASDVSVWTRLDRVRENFDMRGCYCSVLDDCWVFDSRRRSPQPVQSCPAPELPIYQG